MSRSWPVALALATFLSPAAFAQQPQSPNLAAVQCEMAKVDAQFAATSWIKALDMAQAVEAELKTVTAERDSLAAKLKDAEAGKAPAKTE